MRRKIPNSTGNQSDGGGSAIKKPEKKTKREGKKMAKFA